MVRHLLSWTMGIAAFCAVGGLSAPVGAQPVRDACLNEEKMLEPLVQIAACTALLDEEPAGYTEAQRGIVRHVRGDAYRRAGQYDKAMADQDEALRLAPGLPFGRIGRGDIFIDQKKYTEASHEYTEALLLQSDSIMALAGRAQAESELGNYNHVLKDLDKLIEIKPDMSLTFAVRCTTRATMELELDKATSDCERALELSGGSADAYDSRGLLRLKLGDAAGAYADYNAAVKKDSGNPDFLFGRGIAAIRLGRTKKGEADLAKAKEIDPRVTITFAKYGIND